MPLQPNFVVDPRFRSAPVNIIGVDPGPTHCAIAKIRTSPDSWFKLEYAYYLPIEYIETKFDMSVNSDTIFAYESCACQGNVAGALVFETAANGGATRCRAAVLGVPRDRMYRFTPSDWRYILTGFGTAKTPDVYASLSRRFEPFGGGHDVMRGTQTLPGPLRDIYEGRNKGFAEHLKDAIGIAISVTCVETATGRPHSAYRCQNKEIGNGLAKN